MVGAYSVSKHGTFDTSIKHENRDYHGHEAASLALKVIISKSNEDHMKKRLRFPNKYVQKESQNSVHLRDHTDPKSDHLLPAQSGIKRNLDMKKWI